MFRQTAWSHTPRSHHHHQIAALINFMHDEECWMQFENFRLSSNQIHITLYTLCAVLCSAVQYTKKRHKFAPSLEWEFRYCHSIIEYTQVQALVKVLPVILHTFCVYCCVQIVHVYGVWMGIFMNIEQLQQVFIRKSVCVCLRRWWWATITPQSRRQSLCCPSSPLN